MIIANVLQATVPPAPTAASGTSAPASGAVAASGSVGGFAAHLPQTGGAAAGSGDVSGFVGLVPAGGAQAAKTRSSVASAQLLGSTALPQAEGVVGATEVPGLFAGQVVAGRPAAKLTGEGAGAGEGMVLPADPSDGAGEAEAQAAAAGLAGPLLAKDTGRPEGKPAPGSAGKGVVPAHADVRAGGAVVHGLGAGKAALAEQETSADPAPGSTQRHEDAAQRKGAVDPLPGSKVGVKGVAGLPEAAVAGSGRSAVGETGGRGGSPVADSDGAFQAVAEAAARKAEAGGEHRAQRGAAPVEGGPEVQTQAQTHTARQTKPVMFPALKDGVPTGETAPAVQVSGAVVAGAGASEGAVRQVTAEAQGQVLPAGKTSSLTTGGATPAAPGASLNENTDEAPRATASGAGGGADPDKAAARPAQAAGAGGDPDKNSPQVDAGGRRGVSQTAAPRAVAGPASAAALRGVEAVEVDVRATIAVTGNEGAKAAATASAHAAASPEKEQASARVATMVPGQAATGRRSADGGVIGAAAAVTPTDAQEGAPLSGREGQVAVEPLPGDEAEQSAERKPIANGNAAARGEPATAAASPSQRPGVSAAALAFAAAMSEQGGAKPETDADGALEFGRAEPMPGSSASHAMARGTAPQPLPQHAAAASVQVASEVARQASKGVNRFQIRLDPAELGRIDVDMKIGADGTVRAHLAVERSETLDMFLRDQRGLERALDAAGLKLDGGSLQFSLKDQGGFAGFGRDGAADQMAETGGAVHEAAAAGELADASALPARVHVDGASGALDIQI